MAYGPSTRTATDVKRSVQRTFGDESGVQLEDADLIMWINDAQEEIVKRNKLIKTTATSSTVADQAEYTFPSNDILQIESLHVGGTKINNVPFAQADLDLISDDLAAERGTPVAWWEWGGTFTLYPAPSTVLPIKLYYTKRPTRITLLTETLSLPDKFFKQIVDYVLQQAYEMDEEPEMSQMKQAQFENGLLEMADEERAAQQMTYQTITFVEL